MSDGIWNATGGLCEDDDDLDMLEDEVKCAHERNGKCTLSGCDIICPYADYEKETCYDFKNAEEDI